MFAITFKQRVGLKLYFASTREDLCKWCIFRNLQSCL